MLSQFAWLNAIKQNITISVRRRLRNTTGTSIRTGTGTGTSTVRITEVTSNKAIEPKSRRSAASVGDIVRIAALIGLPVVYTKAATSSSTSTPLSNSSLSHKKMSEESNLQSVLQNADQLFDQNHFQEVVDLLNKYENQASSDIQWRKARALYSVSKATKDKHEKEKQVKQSFEWIKEAVATDSTNFAIHKWMAIILDAASEQEGIKARILQLDSIKFHMDEAARLNPEDPTTWHMMGAYEYGLAELSWIQRKLVATIFASPPTGSFERALEHFEKAERLKEGFYSTNWLMLGKCHIALKQSDKAKCFLEKAANCAVLNEDDKKSKEEAVALLRKL